MVRGENNDEAVRVLTYNCNYVEFDTWRNGLNIPLDNLLVTKQIRIGR